MTELEEQRRRIVTRIRPLKEEDVDPESRVHFERDRVAFRTVLDSTGIAAYCPPILNATKVIGAAIEASGRLPRELRCLLNVRAAAMVGCPF